jgi:leader peptidase (prepilin peptidase)/N-methyltransferase
MEVIVFVLGIVIGSFLNVVILRSPKGENIAYPASHCPTCKTPLKWWHNIPILSWILLKGKCGFCSEKISIQYPIIELITGIIFFAVYYKVGFTIVSLFLMLSFASLLVVSMIDFKYKEISFLMNVIPISFVMLYIVFMHIQSPTQMVNSFITMLSFIGFAVLLRDYVSAYKKVEAMGEGDLLIFGIIGAILGIQLGTMAILMTGIYAIIPALFYRIMKKELETPLIPFLSLGLFTVWFFDELFLELMTKISNFLVS